jgi:hypothetical protein
MQSRGSWHPRTDRNTQEAKVVKYMVAGALAAFVVSGPLQHVGALPQTVVGDLSKQAIKTVLGLTAKEAFAGCKGSGGFGGGGGKHGNNGGKQGNNGFGNGGFDGVPGKSGDNNSHNAKQKKDDRDR